MKKFNKKLLTILVMLVLVNSSFTACSLSNSKITSNTSSKTSVSGHSSVSSCASVKWIDFSCKHNVMIKNDDGSLTTMDQPYFKSTLIALRIVNGIITTTSTN
ncbi:hypothetical protein ACJDU8_23365 [Clostridium sp. WILCCON 0269]|uniref:Uncharacterized protein n=1 Tax=Candidatus Clostridium eludens TaxID=3381663 RepID=A0ABW8SQY6_9CLOT